MSYSAADLIKIAQAEIGYHEKLTNANLDQKTAPNDGPGNYTKYARDLNNAGYYNGNKNGYDWCDVFNDWCHWVASGKNKSLAEYVICQTGTLGAGCTWSAQYYQQAGRYYTRNPKPGDQIFFRDFDHTGIVEIVSEDSIATIEGNTSSQVARRYYSRYDSYITGFGRPRYGEDTDEDTDIEEPEVPSDDTIKINVKMLSLNDTGNAVKSLQTLLETHGYSCGSAGIDGEFGSDTEKAVMHFQKDKKIDVDGIAGDDTWNKLINSAYEAPSSDDDSSSSSSTDGYTCSVSAPMISKGSAGKAVVALQAMLEVYGYSCGAYGVDGDFGEGTESAVKDFQSRHDLDIDGIVGDNTWAAIIK